MKYENRKLLIDTDPGIDDAFALFFAMARPEFEILGITAVSGNSPVDATLANALRIAAFAGKKGSIPVIRGHERPLRAEPHVEAGEDCCHGIDGLGGSRIPYTKEGLHEGTAENFILQTLAGNDPGTVTLVSIGPMTNVAAAIQKDPETMKRVREIYSMGGAVPGGNMTPVAEFNYWADPDAAAVCYESGIPIRMVGLNATEQIVLTDREADRIRDYGGKITDSLVPMLEHSFAYYKKECGLDGMIPHDLLAMEACLNPELITWKPCHVEVSCTKVTRGECVADVVDAWKQPKNCYVAGSVDRERFLRLFFETLLPEKGQ